MRILGTRRRLHRPLKVHIGHSVGVGFLLGLIGCCLFYLWAAPPPPVPTINQNVRKSYQASCRINLPDGAGAGVLLNTGFVLTAAHNVDVDLDGVLSKKERKVKMDFFDSHGKAYSYDGYVIKMGKGPKRDFALIKPTANIKSGVRFLTKRPLLGDKLHTIGCPKTLAPHLTYGHQSLPSNKDLSRASMSVYMGNSGGGVFNENQDLVGITIGVGIDFRFAGGRFTTVERIEGGIIIRNYNGSFRYSQTLANWTEYVRNEEIYKALVSVNLGFAIILPETEVDLGIPVIYFRMSLQIFVLFVAVWFLRKELFK